MEIKRIGNYEFVNESGITRNGFFHKSTLFKNGNEIISSRCNYLNRTWECYKFQTSMKCCVRDLINERKDNLENNFRKVNMITRMTSKKKEELLKIFENDSIIAEYNELYEALDI